MSELRQNMATKEWVVLAVERSERPEEFAQPDRPLTEDRPEREATCPFCPGNEERELEILRRPTAGSWRARVVRNKFPALQEHGDRLLTFDGVHRQISGVGHHEVVIQSPRHNTCIALDTPTQVTLVLEIFKARCRELAQDPRVEQIICFENHGQRAGTSLVHPHAQIIALPIVPFEIRSRIEEARRYFDDTARCVYCHMLSDEVKVGTRIIAESEHFVAFILYAAFSPFHTWIVPRRHEPSFLRATAHEMADLGDMLHRVLRKVYVGLKDPDYNYAIRTAPLCDPGYDYLHWYITLIPRVTRTAGFELGSGMFINSAMPEDSAAFLRSVRVD